MAAASFVSPARSEPAAAPPAATGEVVVATRPVTPFVNVGEGGRLTGFSIDLWRALGVELGWKARFQTYKTLPELLDAVRSGKNPLGIAAISVTADRASRLDFSQPMFRSGLTIMVPSGNDKVDVLSLILSKSTLAVIGILALVILLPAHIFWFIARGRDEGLPIRNAYIPGVFDAMFWCAESMGGAPQGYPRLLFPRVVALVWLYTGILLIAYFTAFATASLTISTLQGAINGPDDLPGKRVAVVKGSTGAEYMAGSKATIAEFTDFPTCAAALLDSRVDAVVYDALIIQHYAKKEGRVRTAGKQFRPESYGIAFPVGSPLRRNVDQALLKIMENGTYDTLVREWLGDVNNSEPNQ